MPIFGIVEAIYLSDNDSIVFAVEQFETISYCTYRQCYIVRNAKNQNLINKEFTRYYSWGEILKQYKKII